MYKSRFYAFLVEPGLQHVIDMTANTRAALHCQTCRLVEDENLWVLIKEHLGKKVAVILAAHGARRQWAVAFPVDCERGDSDQLASFDAGVGLGPAAIDTYLARSQEFLKLDKTEARIVRLEPAVEPHAGFARFHSDLLHACHFRAFPLPAREIASGKVPCEPHSDEQRDN